MGGHGILRASRCSHSLHQQQEFVADDSKIFWGSSNSSQNPSQRSNQCTCPENPLVARSAVSPEKTLSSGFCYIWGTNNKHEGFYCLLNSVPLIYAATKALSWTTWTVYSLKLRSLQLCFHLLPDINKSRWKTSFTYSVCVKCSGNWYPIQLNLTAYDFIWVSWLKSNLASIII